MTGEVVHFELPVDDPARAKAFYADSFGWMVSDVPGMDYTIVSTVASDETGRPSEPGAINGGLTRRQGAIMTPVVTIQVDDIDRTLLAVERHGGKVVQGRQQVGDMGFSGYFADTEGNVVGIWQTVST
jgi:predicted enzyme related to lactoylglutathione lyase